MQVLNCQMFAVDLNPRQVRTPVPTTISSGIDNSPPDESFRSPAKISASAFARVFDVSFAISGRKGAATSVNCCQYSSGAPFQCPVTVRLLLAHLKIPPLRADAAAGRAHRT